jgi:1,4-alpha-glucan branching enzyme
MRVLQLVPEFPPPLTGGGGYHVNSLAQELVKRGVDVTVYTFRIQCPFGRISEGTETHFGKVKVHRIPAFYIPKTMYPVGPKLLPLLLREQADIIHAHGYQIFTSDMASIASRLRKIPLVLTLHGFPADFRGSMHRLYFDLIGKETLRVPKKMIAISKLVERQFRAIGVDERRLVMIPNGVNQEEFREMPDGRGFRQSLGIGEDEKLILTIGRLEKTKGFQYLIEALPQILEKAGSVKLLIAGPESNYGTELARLARMIGVEKRVIFYGAIDGEQKLKALAAADIVVIPSIYEGFSVFLLESLAAGKPLVATRTGIALEIIRNGENGFLVNPCDSKDIAEKVVMLLVDNNLSSLISSRSRATIEAFDWKHITERILKVYHEILVG